MTPHTDRYDAASTADSIVTSWLKKHHAASSSSSPASPPPAAAAAAATLALACTLRPCGLAASDTVLDVVTAASATGCPCFWWIQDTRAKQPLILKVSIDAGVFGGSKLGCASAGNSSTCGAFTSVYSILCPDGFTLRDVASAVAHKAAAQGLVPPTSSALDCTFVVCACSPHPHLPPAVTNHAIVGSGAHQDMPVCDVMARLGVSCQWSARGAALHAPVVLPIALPLPVALRSYNVVIAGAATDCSYVRCGFSHATLCWLACPPTFKATTSCTNDSVTLAPTAPRD